MLFSKFLSPYAHLALPGAFVKQRGILGFAPFDVLHLFRITFMDQKELQEGVKKFPKRPGVYVMKGPKGEILYVGKATDLRSRVGSYFLKEAASRYQISFLMSKVGSIEPIITDTPKEALLLENTLIKKHRPRYNIHLKDDKSYVSLKLSLRDKAPRLYVTRRIKKDGSLYFGPYSSAMGCREVVDFIQRHFRLRTCSDHDYRNRVRPCLQYQIKRCDAPCVGLIGLEEYSQMVEQVRLFLEGRNDELKKVVLSEMKKAAKEEHFEDAARYRDLLSDMERVLEKQKVVSHSQEDRDIIGIYREGPQVLFYVMLVREGSLQDHRVFPAKSYEEESDLLANFLAQYYEAGRSIPNEILLASSVEGGECLEEILKERAGHRVSLLQPQRGEKHSLVLLANQNAKQAFASQHQKEKDQQAPLEELQKLLHLRNIPQRLECYDISNFQGKESMGSMVTFLKGRAESKLYRHFKIKTVLGANDFASIYEVLSRRFRRLEKEGEGSIETPWARPDLMVIDGGKGQLQAAHQALKDRGIEGIDLIALAKSKLLGSADPKTPGRERERSEERVFLLGRKDPVLFPKNSAALFLLMKARDEAHRFGIEAHRKWRRRRTLYSGLEEIEGVGKVRSKKLLQHFGSLARLRSAPPEEIAQTLGGSLELGKRIKESL